jgi:hypothetical protein
LGLRESLFRITFDQGLQKGGLANSRRTDNGNEAGRWLLWQAIYQRDVEALLFDLL